VIYPDKGRYEGSFVNNLRSGNRNFTFTGGSSYFGSWHNNLKHGKGIFMWSDGNKFSDEWCNGDSKSGIRFEINGLNARS
jgi:hypothetical protein